MYSEPFLILAYLKFPLRKNIQKNSFLRGGVAEGEWSIFSTCFELTREGRPYLQGEIVFPISFPWGLFGHKVSELLSSIVNVPPGDLVCSWRSHSSVKIDALLPLDLGTKGFYPRRDKSGLKDTTQT
jgi:hypothetical protein